MTNYNDGNWHKVNGNKPESVHSLSEVEMKWIILDTGKVVESNRIAKHFEWRDFGDVFGIAFRVIKEHKEPREFWVCYADGKVMIYSPEHDPIEYADFGFIHVREVLE